MEEEKTSEIVTYLLDKQILLSPDSKEKIILLKEKLGEMEGMTGGGLVFLDKDILEYADSLARINWADFEKARAEFEKRGEGRAYLNFIQYLSNKPGKEKQRDVKIISSFGKEQSKKEVMDFTLYFNSRFEALQRMLYNREEMKAITTISRIQSKKEREQISLIGMVAGKQVTKNGNIILSLEDNTGEINVLVNKTKPEIYELAKDIVLDEVVGVSGVAGANIVFANTLLFPDIPFTQELKKSPEESYAVFLSDLHVGSKKFLSEDFQKFLDWINLNTGSEKQREIASKVKYIFIVGDLVDGVGVYPNQEEDLDIKDVYQQYGACAELLSRIPSHINLIICPGNHDSLRMAEPQPAFTNDFCRALFKLQNAVFVSNPATVNIGSAGGFSGFNVLLYHGYSFDYYINEVGSIRNNGGYDRADLMMKFLLKRRHLAPTHSSTLYSPYTSKDPMLIDIVPDFFISGHIHKSAALNYKNITLICGSCWQSKTDFQEKMGHKPEPGKVPIANLATREIKILRFSK